MIKSEKISTFLLERFHIGEVSAEEKARATYEHLIDVTKDEDLIQPLLFLRQREIVHYHRFKELYEYYKKQMGY